MKLLRQAQIYRQDGVCDDVVTEDVDKVDWHSLGNGLYSVNNGSPVKYSKARAQFYREIDTWESAGMRAAINKHERI